MGRKQSKVEEALHLVLKKYTILRHRYKETYLRWQENRWKNISSLLEITEALEETRNKCNIVSLGGGCAGLVGGILTGAGLICIPFTVGASTPLIIAGASLAVSGGATGFGAGMADMKLSKSKCQQAQELIDKDVELTLDLLIKEKEYAQCLEEVEQSLIHLQTERPDDYDKLRHYLSSGVSTLGGATRFSTNLFMVATVARSLYLASAMRVVDSMDDAVEAGSQVGVAAMRGAKAGFAAAAVLCVVGLAMDITSIVYTSRQIHVYRKQQLAKSMSSQSIHQSTQPNPPLQTEYRLVDELSHQNNNRNSIYLRSIDREFHSDNDLCSWTRDIPSKNPPPWQLGKCVNTSDLEDNSFPPISRKLSDSWEKIDITADMMIEVDEECPFKNQHLSLEFDTDLMSDTASNVTTSKDDQRTLLDDDQDKTKDNVLQKVKHSFTRDYISERAEKLKNYVRRLQAEAVSMESNPTIQDMINQCSCKSCLCIGGGSRQTCCQSKRFYWNSVGTGLTLDENTPCLCITQHPQFKDTYLNTSYLLNLYENTAKQKWTTPPGASKLPKYRLLRFYAYHQFVSDCWGNNEIMLRIPDCMRRAVVNAFQPDIEHFWISPDGFNIKDLWIIKDNTDCVLM